MCFIAAGMGGGTGTGAAPVIAKAARDRGILTVGVVTKPFSFEGNRRMRSAESGIEELQKHVDTLIVIPNQNLFLIANPNTTFKEAFKMADEVLQQGVRGITDLMVMPGLINLDFADVRSVMSEMGKAMMGTGEATGDNRAIEAAEKAISNPLLDGVSMQGAKGVIISITGGEDMRLMEVDEAANHIKELVDPDANIIWGSAFNNDLDGRIRVSVVATGIEAEAGKMAEPAKLFTFPAKTKAEAPAAAVPTPAQASVAAPEPEPAPAVVAEETVAAEAILPSEPVAVEASDTFELDESLMEPIVETASTPPADELLLGDDSILTSPPEPNPVPPSDGTRSWLSRTRESQPEPQAKAKKAESSGGTLFERMSSLARGASKAQVEEENDSLRSRDPLDIPRFLNRQNNP